MTHNNIPPRDMDEVLTLYAHYFLAAELMFNNYKNLLTKRNQCGYLSQDDSIQLSIYFCTWLGFLGVTAEGFKKLAIHKLIQEARPPEFAELVPHTNALGKLLKKNADALRRFRNNVFHLRENPNELERFLRESPNRLEWAEELQTKFGLFFSIYRILCQVQYAIEERKDDFLTSHPG